MKKLVIENLNEGFATTESNNLDKISSILGYDDFAEFIGDNPGCYEVIMNWIDKTFSDELSDEGLEPKKLESMGLYIAADKTRELGDPNEDEDNVVLPDENLLRTQYGR